jgi:type III secretion system low calcium response chaperone LcrH/SycD
MSESGLSEEYLARLEEITLRVYEGKSTLQIEKGITAEEMETVYSHGYTLFQGGRSDDALAIFQYLALHDPLEPKYFTAVAACLEERHDYEAAARHYLQALLLSKNDPMPGYRGALCLRAVGKMEEAEGMLHLAIEHTVDSPENDAVKEQAAILRDEIALINSSSSN